MNITDAASPAVAVVREAPSSPPPARQTPTAAPPPAVAALIKPPQVTDVKTHFDDMSGMLVASVIDKETGSVVTEVPPEALRALAARTAEFRGKLFDTKV